MSIVTIKEVQGVVTCADDGTAEHVFNVKNATEKAITVGMQLAVPENTQADWLNIDGPSEHHLDVETMTQVSVKIKVPPDGGPGKYSYRLRVFDPERPGEIYTDGDPVYFEIPEKKKPVVPEEENGKKPFKWWIPAAIAACVLIIVVAVWIGMSSGVKLPDFTQIEWDQAKAEEFLKDNDVQYKIKLQLDPAPGSEKVIIGQDPAPDTKLKKEEIVTLKIAGTRVPPLKGESFSKALEKISSSGLSFDTDKDLKIKTVSQAAEHERIVDQSPQTGSFVAKKSDVKLTVGRLAAKKFEFNASMLNKVMPGINMSRDFKKKEVAPISNFRVVTD